MLWLKWRGPNVVRERKRKKGRGGGYFTTSSLGKAVDKRPSPVLSFAVFKTQDTHKLIHTVSTSNYPSIHSSIRVDWAGEDSSFLPVTWFYLLFNWKLNHTTSTSKWHFNCKSFASSMKRGAKSAKQFTSQASPSLILLLVVQLNSVTPLLSAGSTGGNWSKFYSPPQLVNKFILASPWRHLKRVVIRGHWFTQFESSQHFFPPPPSSSLSSSSSYFFLFLLLPSSAVVSFICIFSPLLFSFIIHHGKCQASGEETT